MNIQWQAVDDKHPPERKRKKSDDELVLSGILWNQSWLTKTDQEEDGTRKWM